MNRKFLLITAVVVVVAAGLFLWQNADRVAQPQKQPQAQPQESARASLLTQQISTEGPVTVSVTPLAAATGSELDFQIVLDTHSEELANNMIQSAALIGDDGKEYLPAAWEGDPPSGHHRQGILKFTAIQGLQRLELRIRGIGGIPERIFRWNLPG